MVPKSKSPKVKTTCTDRAIPFESLLQLASCSSNSNGMARSVHKIYSKVGLKGTSRDAFAKKIR